MSLRKRLRNLVHNLKDKASVITAALSFKRHVSSVHVHVLRATTHSLSTPLSEARVAAVLSTGHGLHHLPRVCINALMDRLNRTRSATVALKCLFMLHNVVAKGPLTLKDHLSYYPSHGGHNFLNLSTFRDDSDLETLELSSWVQWYAGVVEQVLTVSRILGYYLSSFTPSSDTDSMTRERQCLRASSADLLYKIEGLLVFVEQVSRVPESLHLQRNDLVYEVVRLVGEDYRSVQREIFMRVEELGNRVGNLDVGELRELGGYLKRLEECKERLVLLFVNRKRNSGFWDLIGETKRKGVAMKEEIEGKWLSVVKERRRDESTESTRFTNPFLDPGQLIPVPSGGAWPAVNQNGIRITVPTAG